MSRPRETDWRLLIPPSIRLLPADLATVIASVGIVNAAVFLPVLEDTPLRVIVGLPFVLFIPGYAFIAALFPEAGTSPQHEGEGGETELTNASSSPDGDEQSATGALRTRGIDGIERVALSFGLSIAIVPLIGLLLNFTPWGIRLVPIMIGISIFTLGATWIAARRRRAVPPEDRFAVPYRTWIESIRSELFQPESNTDLVLNILLVISILLAVSSVSYAVAVPKQGESLTEFYLLTEDESGALVADEYPTEFVAGEERQLIIGIGNQEHQAINYTVVVELQRVEFETGTQDQDPNATSPTGNITSIQVLEAEELGRIRTRLRHNDTWQRPYTIRPTMTGQNLRLAFLLYKGSPPRNPTVDTAYIELRLWVNVSQAQNSQNIVRSQPSI